MVLLYFIKCFKVSLLLIIDIVLCLQGLRFEVVPSWFKETLNKSHFKAPHQYAVETARQKALEVARRMPFVSQALNVSTTIITHTAHLFIV